MVNGITYFRLVSNYYEGDTTKRSGLEGCDIDRNFYFLEGKTIKEVFVSEDKRDLVIRLMDGTEIVAENAFGSIKDNFSFDFDVETGTLTIKYLGEILDELTGFVSRGIMEEYVSESNSIYTDNTLVGNGNMRMPLGIHPMYRTGLYRAVDRFIDSRIGETLPSPSEIGVGDRFLTNEEFSTFGILYNFDGVKRLKERLAEANSPWRVPTKEDWDDMLNAIEPDPEYANHDSYSCNRYFGQMAGAILRQNGMWTLVNPVPNIPVEQNVNSNDEDEDGIGGDYSNSPYCPSPISDNPDFLCLNDYGFDALPSGYSNDSKDLVYFYGDIYGDPGEVVERTGFWTSTTRNDNSAYIKRIDNMSDKIYQDIVDGSDYYSIRLVKDYTYDNYSESEEILDETYTTSLMPSKTSGHKVWTSMNISIGVGKCRCFRPSKYDGINVRYFIWEWDGVKWMRNELRRGEAVYIDQMDDYTYVTFEPTGSEVPEMEWECFNTVEEMPNASAVSSEYVAVGNCVFQYQELSGTDYPEAILEPSEPDPITIDSPRYIKIFVTEGTLCYYKYFEKVLIEADEYYKKETITTFDSGIYLLKKVKVGDKYTMELIPITGGGTGTDKTFEDIPSDWMGD